MPKLVMNYANTIIYKIVCDDLTVKECYVGHTTNFVKRKAAHKSDCNNINSKKYNFKVYTFIRLHGTWDNWSMIEIEKFPCNDVYEACARERHYYEKLNASNLNSNVPSRTPTEYMNDNEMKFKAHTKKYRDDNKEKIKERHRQYRIDNKDKINKYLEDNKDEIKNKNKQYRENNKEIIKAKRKEYLEKNKEKLKARRKQNYENKKNVKIKTQNNKQNIMITENNEEIKMEN